MSATNYKEARANVIPWGGAFVVNLGTFGIRLCDDLETANACCKAINDALQSVHDAAILEERERCKKIVSEKVAQLADDGISEGNWYELELLAAAIDGEAE